MRIAYLLWSHSRNKPKMQRPRPRQRRSTATQQKNVKPPPTKRNLTTKQSLDSKLKAKQRNERRKRYRNQRIVLVGSRPQGRIRSSDPSPLTQLKGIINRKRTAESVAAGQSAVATLTQRHAPPTKRRKSRNT